MTVQPIKRIYPTPLVSERLEGLYLREDFGERDGADAPFVYTNFIASLDGRIAVRDGDEQSPYRIPPAIANERDWRLYQELAARADVIVVGAGYARAIANGCDRPPFPFARSPDQCDLTRWRIERGLPKTPVLAVVSQTLDIPFGQLAQALSGRVCCLAGRDVARARADLDAGVPIYAAGPGRYVSGRGMVEALSGAGYGRIYSVAGGGVMRALVEDRQLDRLYLTQVHRLIGGEPFKALVEAPSVAPPLDADLTALYLDAEGPDGGSQSYAVYDFNGDKG